MKKKILIVGSAGHFGRFAFNQLKKDYDVIGIERKKNKNRFACEDLSNFKLNYETFKLLNKYHKKFAAMLICTGNSQKISGNISQKLVKSMESNLLTVTNSIETYQKVYRNKPIKIIVLSSIVGIKRMDAPLEYSVSKSALNHFCLIKSKELSKFKIKLNIISPGNILFKKNNWSLKIKKNRKKIERYIKKVVPLNSFCKPTELLALCNLLISEEGNFFQGSNIVIDGGQII